MGNDRNAPLTAYDYAKRLTHLRALTVGNIEAEFQQAMDAAAAQPLQRVKELEEALECLASVVRAHPSDLKRGGAMEQALKALAAQPKGGSHD